MHPVQKIFPTEILPEKQQEIISQLEMVLRKAYAGEIEGFGLVLMCTDNTHEYWSSTLQNKFEMLGILALLTHKISKGSSDG